MDSERRFWSPRAQTSVIGVVLIIGLTLAAASAVVVFGSGAIDDGRQHSRVGQAEQAMTQFDSRAAQVALGESDVQTVRFGQGGGNYEINETAGSVTVYHADYNQYNDTETVFAKHRLGVLRYRSGGSTIAYQGGGVWRSDGEGASTMISPPEFHYRTATLTYPIIRISGDGAASGRVNARVSSIGDSKQVFPNATQSYENSSRRYLNPIDEGNMTIEITSEYCEGWRSYFESRTEGVVEDHCSVNDTVRAQLATLGTQGSFSLQDQNTLRIRGMESGHALQSFELRFVGDDTSSSSFDNFNWSISGTDEQGNEIGISFYDGGKPCKHGPQPVRTVVYFNNASNDDYGAFVINKSNPDAYHTECVNDTAILAVDLMNDSRNATYTTLGNKDPFDPDGSLHSTEVFDEHNGTVTEEPISFNDGDQAAISLAVGHYFGLLGDADLETDEQVKGQSSIGPESSGTVEYEGSGQVVTFLHITDNELRVELE